MLSILHRAAQTLHISLYQPMSECAKGEHMHTHMCTYVHTRTHTEKKLQGEFAFRTLMLSSWDAPLSVRSWLSPTAQDLPVYRTKTLKCFWWRHLELFSQIKCHFPLLFLPAGQKLIKIGLSSFFFEETEKWSKHLNTTKLTFMERLTTHKTDPTGSMVANGECEVLSQVTVWPSYKMTTLVQGGG